jgi:hypothetical protein
MANLGSTYPNLRVPFSGLDTLTPIATTDPGFIIHGNQTAKPLMWSDTVEKLEHKLASNLWPALLKENCASRIYFAAPRLLP